MVGLLEAVYNSTFRSPLSEEELETVVTLTVGVTERLPWTGLFRVKSRLRSTGKLAESVSGKGLELTVTMAWSNPLPGYSSW